jgi:hypothetical protein
MLPEATHRYLLHGLAATPIVIDRLLLAATPADYDRRPDPERFTLREVIAHLADWEPVWHQRLQRVRTEEQPMLPGYDESQWAIDHDYAHAAVPEQMARFREGRARLLAFLRDLSPEDWDRTGQHSQWGRVTLADLAVLVLGHDGYHLRQIADWLDAGRAG